MDNGDWYFKAPDAADAPSWGQTIYHWGRSLVTRIMGSFLTDDEVNGYEVQLPEEEGEGQERRVERQVAENRGANLGNNVEEEQYPMEEKNPDEDSDTEPVDRDNELEEEEYTDYEDNNGVEVREIDSEEENFTDDEDLINEDEDDDYQPMDEDYEEDDEEEDQVPYRRREPKPVLKRIASKAIKRKGKGRRSPIQVPESSMTRRSQTPQTRRKQREEEERLKKRFQGYDLKIQRTPDGRLKLSY